jgi:uncharacterized protein YjiS (DUF1127 family)
MTMSDHNYAHAGTGPGVGFAESAAGWLRQIAQRLGAAHDRYRQRRALLTLDDARLDDIGISREAALAEGRMPIWR